MGYGRGYEHYSCHLKDIVAMKIPPKLKVLGIDYEVRRPEVVECDGDVAIGMHSGKDGFIAIKRDLTPTMAEATFFHEIVHAVNIGDTLSEEQVEQIARGLYQVLKDNNLLRE